MQFINIKNEYGPRREKTCLRKSLISAFDIRVFDGIISKLATNKIPIFWQGSVHVAKMGGGGGGGGTRIGAYIYECGPCFGVQIFQFQYILGFSEKSKLISDSYFQFRPVAQQI